MTYAALEIPAVYLSGRLVVMMSTTIVLVFSEHEYNLRLGNFAIVQMKNYGFILIGRQFLDCHTMLPSLSGCAVILRDQNSN